MADIELKFTGDLKDLKHSAKESSKLIKRFQKVNQKTFNKIKKVHEETAKAITKTEETEQKKRESMESRLSRKRARNRLRIKKQRIRDEQKESRERERIAKQTARNIERVEKSEARRRARIRAGVSRGAGRVLGGAGRVLGGIGLGLGVGAIFKAKDILTQDEALARVSAQANISVEGQMKLKHAILATTLEYGIQRDVITQAASTIVDKSGNIALASENLGDIAKIIRGTGADASEVGQLYASIANSFKGSGKDLLPTEISKFVEILIAQGDKAQITLADLAGSGEKLFGAFKGAGLKSVKDFIAFGALIQTSGEAGDAAEAATSAVRVLSEITKQQEKLAKFGVEIFKPGSDSELRNIDELLKDILVKTGGSVTKLQTIFTERAIKPIKILAAEFRNTNGEIGEFEKLINAGATAADNIDRKFSRVAMGANQGFAQLGALINVMANFALAPVLDDLAKFFKSIAKNKSALAEIEASMRGIAKVIQIITKIGTAPFSIARNFFGGFADDMAERTLSKNTMALALAEQAPRGNLPALSSSVTETNLQGGESAVERWQIKVENTILTDNTGNIEDVDTIIKTQKDFNRGAFSTL